MTNRDKLIALRAAYESGGIAGDEAAKAIMQFFDRVTFRGMRLVTTHADRLDMFTSCTGPIEAGEFDQMMRDAESA